MIKIAELFYSMQGEGLYQGVPSVFLRVFGCNFKCRGFGMPKGQLSDEYLKIDPKDYKSYKNLPLVHTGCDSYASWDPRFKNLSPVMTPNQICDRMEEIIPGGKFTDNIHLIMTGGEPLLGWQKQYTEVFRCLHKRRMVNGILNVTFETNGTQELNSYLKEYLNWYTRPTFSISSKLPSSGEPWEKAFQPKAVASYKCGCNHTRPDNTYFKWVVSNKSDLADVQMAIQEYANHGIRHPVYLMPAGGTTKLYDQNKKWVAELAMANGWRYSQRLQVDLWKNQWGT